MEDLTARYANALEDAGYGLSTRRQRVYAITATARTAGKAPADITQEDAVAHCRGRGQAPSSTTTFVNHVAQFARWRRTGLVSPVRGAVRYADIAPAFEAWLLSEDGPTGVEAVRTARSYARHVVSLARHAGVHPDRVTTEQVRAYLDHLDAAKRTYPYINKALRSITLWGEHTERPEITAGIRRMCERKRRNPSRPRPVDDLLLARMLRAASPQTRAMLVLGAMGGMRSAEIGMVCGEDITIKGGECKVSIIGKGNVLRVVDLNKRDAARLDPVWTKGKTGRLFPGLSEDPENAGRTVNRRLADLAASLGDEVTSHQFRHWFGSMIYEMSGGDIVATKEALGHASVDTTILYVKALRNDRRRLADALSDHLDDLLIEDDGDEGAAAVG